MALKNQEQWDFYPARVNDAPASVFLDMSFMSIAPVKDMPRLWWVFLKMESPESHGMGGDEDANILWAAEDEIVPLIEKRLQGRMIGRVRGEGDWQLYFYAPGGSVPNAEIESLVSANQSRPYWVDSKEDSEWSFYRDFLFPSDERYQWMKDRSVVERLAESGDDPSAERDIDHFVYFDNERNRTVFVDRTAAIGFRVDHLSSHPDSTRPYGVQLIRRDRTELQAIHEAVMQLVDLANEFEGEYDGWGAPVVDKQE